MCTSENALLEKLFRIKCVLDATKDFIPSTRQVYSVRNVLHMGSVMELI